MGNNLPLTMVSSSPFFLNNYLGLSVALYKWSWMGIFRSWTWMRNHFSGRKISSSQWLHSKHPFSHSWNYLKHLMPSQRHSSFSWDKKAKVQGKNLNWSELFSPSRHSKNNERKLQLYQEWSQLFFSVYKQSLCTAVGKPRLMVQVVTWKVIYTTFPDIA